MTRSLAPGTFRPKITCVGLATFASLGLWIPTLCAPSVDTRTRQPHQALASTGIGWALHWRPWTRWTPASSPDRKDRPVWTRPPAAIHGITVHPSARSDATVSVHSSGRRGPAAGSRDLRILYARAKYVSSISRRAFPCPSLCSLCFSTWTNPGTQGLAGMLLSDPPDHPPPSV